MEKIIEDVSYLSKEIGPRPGGTEEERRAAVYLAERIQKQSGLSLDIEDFEGAKIGSRAFTVCSLITAILTILSVILPILCIPSLLIAVLSTIILVMELLDKPIISNFLRFGISQNVVAKYIPSATSQGKSQRKRKLIIVSHYDTGKAIANSGDFLLKLKALSKYLSILGNVGCIVILILRAFVVTESGGAGQIVLLIFAILIGVIAVLPLIVSAIASRAFYNEGANCNASANAALIELATKLAEGSFGHQGNEPVIHGINQAQNAGVVPDGASVEYDSTAKVNADEQIDPLIEHQNKLDKAKAALAAFVAPKAPRQRYDNDGNIIDAPLQNNDTDQNVQNHLEGQLSSAEKIPNQDSSQQQDSQIDPNLVQAEDNTQASSTGRINTGVIDDRSNSASGDQAEESVSDGDAAIQDTSENTEKSPTQENKSVSSTQNIPTQNSGVPDWFSAAKAKGRASRPEDQKSENSSYRSGFTQAMDYVKRCEEQRQREIEAAEEEKRNNLREQIIAAQEAAKREQEEVIGQQKHFFVNKENAPKTNPNQSEVQNANPVTTDDDINQNQATQAQVDQKVLDPEVQPISEVKPETQKTIEDPFKNAEQIDASITDDQSEKEDSQDTSAMTDTDNTQDTSAISTPIPEQTKPVTTSRPIETVFARPITEIENSFPSDEVKSIPEVISEKEQKQGYANIDSSLGLDQRFKLRQQSTSKNKKVQFDSVPEIAEDQMKPVAESSFFDSAPSSLKAEESGRIDFDLGPEKNSIFDTALGDNLEADKNSNKAPNQEVHPTLSADSSGSLKSGKIQQYAPLADESFVSPGGKVDKENFVPRPFNSSEIPRFDESPNDFLSSETKGKFGTGSFSAVSDNAGSAGATGAFAPVTDQLLDQNKQTKKADDMIIEDADDDVYSKEGFTESGAFAGRDYVDMPSKKRKGLFGLFGRKTSKHGKHGNANSGDNVISGTDDNWEGGSFSSLGAKLSMKKTANEDAKAAQGQASGRRRVNREADSKGQSSHRNPVQKTNKEANREASNKNNTLSKGKSMISNFMSRTKKEQNQVSEPVKQNTPTKDSKVTRSFIKPRPGFQQQIQDFQQGDVNIEVWFVALGSEIDDNSGMKAFLLEHSNELRGSIILEVEGIGAGQLTLVEHEGYIGKTRVSDRVKRIIRSTANKCGFNVPGVSLPWSQSSAAYASRAGYLSAKLVGMDGNKPAYYMQEDDKIDIIEPDTLKNNIDYLLSLIKNV